MPAKIDLHLRMSLSRIINDDLSDAQRQAFGVLSTPDGDRIQLVVQFTGSVEPLEEAGLTIITQDDDLVTGSIAPANVIALAQLENVLRIEGDAPGETSLDLSVPETNADEVNSGTGVGSPPQTYTGANVIVGVIDTGIDYQHAAFRNAAGNSKILRIWDMSASGGTPPAGFTGGSEWTNTQIDSALAEAAASRNPFAVVPHSDADPATGHGTHVASIAAGNWPTLPGVAPGADLIIASGGISLVPTRIQSVHAMKYMFETARQLGRPCVINQSQAFLRGAHDGTTLTERYMDKLLGRPGNAYVAAAGNFGGDNVHLAATVPGNGSVTFQFTSQAAANPTFWQTFGSMEIWYRKGVQLDIQVNDTGPGTYGPHTQPLVTTDTDLPQTGTTASGTSVSIGFETDVEENHCNHIVLQLSNGGSVEVGTWTVTLTNPSSRDVEIDAYLERSDGIFGFVRPPAPVGETPTQRREREERERAQSVSMPATAREAIAVGSYTTRVVGGSGTVGQISGFSSRGPTRDGRIKPDVCAPGEWINAALARNASGIAGVVGAGTTTGRHLLPGTSMAAPHVAGAVALLLEKDGTLTQEQIRYALAQTSTADANTGTGNLIPNNTWGHGKLNVRALLENEFPAAQSQTWVRIRSTLYNWTMGDRPPSFEIFGSENGTAVIELAWGSNDIVSRPAVTAAEPIRYYNTGESLQATVTKADGSSMALDIPEQQIRLTGNRATWAMPQELWDAYREEMQKGMATPPTGQMQRMLYYRVRFEPTGAASATIWPADSSFNASPFNNRLNIIALSSDASTQVVPDEAAINAMPDHQADVRAVWALPESNADRQSLANIFTNRFFTNSIETGIRGKILTLWRLAGTSRPRLHLLLERQFISPTGLEITVFKQPCIGEGTMLIDHLLAMASIVPHPDILAARSAEQLVEDVIQEILDPNGQVNQGRSKTGGLSALQVMLLSKNASEYARLMRGLLSVSGQSTLANGDAVSTPAGVFDIARYAGDQSPGFYIRTYSELAFQATMLKYAMGSDFPNYDPSAPADSPRGINTVFQTTVGEGVTLDELERALEGVFNRAFSRAQASSPTAALRNQLIQAMQDSEDPLLTVLQWGPAGANQKLRGVVSVRHESSRLMFKNCQYAGSAPMPGAEMNAERSDPPRRIDDPTQTLESIGDDDLAGWVRAFYHA